MSYREARTKHDKIKLMTYIQYIQQCYREKKENHNKKLICKNYTTKNQLDAQLILSVIRQPLHVSGVSRPSSGGKPYICNSWYLLLFFGDSLLSWLCSNPTRTTDRGVAKRKIADLSKNRNCAV